MKKMKAPPPRIRTSSKLVRFCAISDSASCGGQLFAFGFLEALKLVSQALAH
jgi:hypothetical protein